MELLIGQYPNFLWDMGFGLEDTIRRPLAPGLTFQEPVGEGSCYGYPVAISGSDPAAAHARQ